MLFFLLVDECNQSSKQFDLKLLFIIKKSSPNPPQIFVTQGDSTPKTCQIPGRVKVINRVFFLLFLSASRKKVCSYWKIHIMSQNLKKHFKRLHTLYPIKDLCV